MAKRGRPRKNGFQNSSDLVRSLELVFYYDKARSEGDKHEAAVATAVERFKRLHPGAKASNTEVKRSLSLFRGRDGADALIPDISVQTGEELADFTQRLKTAVETISTKFKKKAPPVSPTKMVVANLRIGPRKDFLRNNAKKKPL